MCLLRAATAKSQKKTLKSVQCRTGFRRLIKTRITYKLTKQANRNERLIFKKKLNIVFKKSFLDTKTSVNLIDKQEDNVFKVTSKII